MFTLTFLVVACAISLGRRIPKGQGDLFALLTIAVFATFTIAYIWGGR